MTPRINENTRSLSGPQAVKLTTVLPECRISEMFLNHLPLGPQNVVICPLKKQSCQLPINLLISTAQIQNGYSKPISCVTHHYSERHRTVPSMRLGPLPVLGSEYNCYKFKRFDKGIIFKSTEVFPRKGRLPPSSSEVRNDLIGCLSPLPYRMEPALKHSFSVLMKFFTASSCRVQHSNSHSALTGKVGTNSFQLTLFRILQL